MVVGALAASWAFVISLTGGFVVRVGSTRLSSRTPINAIVLAAIAGLSYAVLWGRARPTMRDDRAWLRLVGLELLAALRERWRHLQHSGIAPALAIVAAGLIAHHWTLARPLFLDEEMIALNVRDRSVRDLAGPLWLGQAAPYGWLVLERAALVMFGTSERALRLVPTLFAIATIGTALWIGRRWMTPLGAAILLLLCGVGQWLSFFSVVLKPYSADAFWALLLPALGAWAVEAHTDDQNRQARRTAVWWMVSAVGQWFANGAVFVTPSCAIALLVIVWRRSGWRAVRGFVLLGFAWSAVFALHYLISLRHAVNSAYLQSYWSFAMPPAAGGVGGTLAWLAAQLKPLADNPGGSELWISMWLGAAAGFALTIRSPLSLLVATVPLSAFALAALRIVPLFERLSLWTVPALYVGIALFADELWRIARGALVRRRWISFAAAAVAGFFVCQVCVDVFRRGRNDIHYGRPPDSNQQLNDRAGVQWLMRYARPGDAILTTRLALPAVWWYGGISISDDNSAGGGRDGDMAVFELDYRAPGPDCQRSQLRDAVLRRTRALVYFGFRFGMAQEFDGAVVGGLGEMGTVKAQNEFAQHGRAAVVDLHAGAVEATGAIPPRGCVVVRPARRW